MYIYTYIHINILYIYIYDRFSFLILRRFPLQIMSLFRSGLARPEQVWPSLSSGQALLGHA